jgi:ankyrin repeat protein
LSRIARLLNNEVANVNVRDEKGDAPLFQVTRNRDKSLAKILIRLGAGVNARNKDGETPILIAAGNRDENFVRLLNER